MSRTFVVVGAGLAGAAAVEAFLQAGDGDRVVLVGDEPHHPYERPPLSKEFLQGGAQVADLAVRPASWYEEQGVEVRLGQRASRLDANGRVLELEGGDRIAYEGLLLATGGRPRRPWEASERVRYLRTIEDASAIRDALGASSRLVVVGAGFIGCEVAASARSRGADVVMVDLFEVPLQTALGERLGRVFEGIHRDAGVDLRMGTAVTSVGERAEGAVVTLEDGAAIEGDLAVVGVGILPETGVAEEAGIATRDGVLVDAALRTSVDGVAAAGDLANHDHPVFGRLRVEHYDSALKQGAHAARTLLGDPRPFQDPHWFWSDQYDHNLQMTGIPGPDDEMVVRGSIEDRDFSAFFLRGGVVTAVVALGRGRDVRRGKALVAERVRPDPRRLADPDVDLRSLATSS